MNYLLPVLVLTLLISGCATGLSSLTDQIRIPFLSDGKSGSKSDSKEKVSLRSAQKKSERAQSSARNHIRPVRASAVSGTQFDRF